jgi:hypothetical protein
LPGGEQLDVIWRQAEDFTSNGVPGMRGFFSEHSFNISTALGSFLLHYLKVSDFAGGIEN